MNEFVRVSEHLTQRYFGSQRQNASWTLDALTDDTTALADVTHNPAKTILGYADLNVHYRLQDNRVRAFASSLESLRARCLEGNLRRVSVVAFTVSERNLDALHWVPCENT